MTNSPTALDTDSAAALTSIVELACRAHLTSAKETLMRSSSGRRTEAGLMPDEALAIGAR